MTLRTTVEAKVVYEATHRWPGAVDHPEVAYLADQHRHLFVIRASVVVGSADRETEFIMLGHEILAWLRDQFPEHDLGELSCESLARALLEDFDLDRCSVHEDDENGAVVERLP